MWHPGVRVTGRQAGSGRAAVCSSPAGGKGSWEVTASPQKTERRLWPAPLFPLFRESQRPVQPQRAAFSPGPRALPQLAGSPLEAGRSARRICPWGWMKHREVWGAASSRAWCLSLWAEGLMDAARSRSTAGRCPAPHRVGAG